MMIIGVPLTSLIVPGCALAVSPMSSDVQMVMQVVEFSAKKHQLVYIQKFCYFGSMESRNTLRTCKVGHYVENHM